MKEHLNLDTTIPQTRATLFINNIQITNKLQRCIRHQLYDKPFQTYLQQKYSWSKETFDQINWEAHATSVRRHKTPKERIQIMKSIHGWRPTKSRLFKINEQKKLEKRENISNLCPLCQRQEETQEHVFKCTQQCVHDHRIKCLNDLRTYCYKKNTFPPVTTILIKNLHHWMENLTIVPMTTNQIIKQFKVPYDIAKNISDAIHQQQNIGWNQIINGRITKKWETLATINWTKSSGTWSSGFINQTLILSQKIWQYRVDNEFGTNEETREKNLRKQLQPKIEQAYKHSEIISIYHAKLLRVPIERRLTFSSTTNKRWLIHINSAEKSFQRNQTKELLKLKKITHFFKPPQQKRSPANTNIPNKRHKTTTLHHSKTKQQTITGIPYKNQPTPNQNNTPKIKYKKRKYLSMTNFIKGQKKTRQKLSPF